MSQAEDAVPQFDPTKKKKRTAGKRPEAQAPRAAEDYTYEELLKRVFRDNAAGLACRRAHKASFVTPEVFRSSKRTIWGNFQATSETLGRAPEHFGAFVSSELGTPGQTDGSGRLVLAGRFTPRQLENVERRYIEEYVACKACEQTVD